MDPDMSTSVFGSLSPSANDQMSSCKITSGGTVLVRIDGNTSYQTIDGLVSPVHCAVTYQPKNNAPMVPSNFLFLRIRIDQNSSSWAMKPLIQQRLMQ